MTVQIFPQEISKDKDGRRHVSLGQTRDGKDEFVTPVTIWEVDKGTGLHVPPGAAEEVNAPRVRLDTDTQTTLEAVQAELELVKSELQTIKENQLSGDQKVQLSGRIMEHYGATIDQRPLVGDVPVGAIYLAVNTEEMWQSNGFEWVVLV